MYSRAIEEIEAAVAEKVQSRESADVKACRPAAFVKGVRIRTTHLGYRKTVKTAAKVNARQYKFKAEGMGEVTVEQYFARSERIQNLP